MDQIDRVNKAHQKQLQPMTLLRRSWEAIGAHMHDEAISLQAANLSQVGVQPVQIWCAVQVLKDLERAVWADDA